MKKALKIIVSIVLIFTLCNACLFLWSYFSSNSYRRVLKMNWDIELPREKEKLVFSYSEPSFHGDGIRYHAIDYPQDESKQTQNILFQIEKIFLDSQTPTELQIARVNELLRQIEIEEAFIPNWNRCQLIYKKQDDGSELFLFYLSDTGTIYIVESFI